MGLPGMRGPPGHPGDNGAPGTVLCSYGSIRNQSECNIGFIKYYWSNVMFFFSQAPLGFRDPKV